jgi:hypothetical protein
VKISVIGEPKGVEIEAGRGRGGFELAECSRTVGVPLDEHHLPDAGGLARRGERALGKRRLGEHHARFGLVEQPSNFVDRAGRIDREWGRA